MVKITPITIFNNGDQIDDDDVVFYLNEEIVLENITFERIFNLILKHHEFFDIVFYRALGGFKIADYFDDFKQEPVVHDFEQPDVLEFVWITDIYGDKDSTEDVNNISFYVDLSARSFNDEEVGYSLTFSSLSEYKHLPITINPNFTIYKNNVAILDVKRHMTLYDIIKSILTEITFYGNPNSREIFRNEFMKITNDLNLDASIHTLSFDELFRNVKDDLDDDIDQVTPES